MADNGPVGERYHSRERIDALRLPPLAGSGRRVWKVSAALGLLALLSGGGVLAAATQSGAGPAGTVQSRPNIIFLFSDDHAAHAVSAYAPYLRYGARLAPTPNIDRLAQQGMLFVNAFVANSICAPSRAAVLTGQYGHLNGVMANGQPLHPTDLAFPGLLHTAGYHTALFGKWHLETRPQGFDHYEILAGQGPYYNPVVYSADDSVHLTGYTTDLMTDRALAWVDGQRRSRQPFLLMLQFNAPHRYWDPGPEQLGLYRDTTFAEPPSFWDDGSGRALPSREQEMTIRYDLFPRDLKLEDPAGLTPEQRAVWDSAYAEENNAFHAADLVGDQLTRWKYQRFIADYERVIAGVDADVGRVLDYLHRTGLDRNTVVVYTSDQGFFLGDHGWFDKRWMYEESLRTPLLVRWPGVVAPASVNRDLVMNLDFAETFLDMAGQAIPAGMQGRSILPLLRGHTPGDWRDAIYYQYFEHPGWHMVARQYGVRTHRYKLIHYYETGEWELFDLQRDPGEMHSLYGDPQYADITRDLKARLVALRAHYRAPAVDPVPHTPFNPGPGLRRPAELIPPPRDTVGG